MCEVYTVYLRACKRIDSHHHTLTYIPIIAKGVAQPYTYLQHFQLLQLHVVIVKREVIESDLHGDSRYTTGL